MCGSGFSSLIKLSGAAHNSAHTGKQILLSQDEFPSQTEERNVILKMAIKCQAWVFHRQVLVLNPGHMHETVPFVPEKCLIFTKDFIVFEPEIIPHLNYYYPKNKTWSLPYTAFNITVTIKKLFGL